MTIQPFNGAYFLLLLLIGLLRSPAMLRLLHGGGPCRRSSGQNSSDRHSR